MGKERKGKSKKKKKRCLDLKGRSVYDEAERKETLLDKKINQVKIIARYLIPYHTIILHRCHILSGNMKHRKTELLFLMLDFMPVNLIFKFFLSRKLVLISSLCVWWM